MQKSVRVGDYFDNDDNGVWSWYLTNIRNGDFEEFVNNKLKLTLLKRFLNEKFDPSNNQHHQTNTKILFISIPAEVHRDILLLENFLRDYFHLERLEHIQITKLTKSKIYNHENHYILVDTLNNFEDPSFLKLVNSRWPQQHGDEGFRNNGLHKGTTNGSFLMNRPDDVKFKDPKLYGTVSERTDSSESLSSMNSYSRNSGDANTHRLNPHTQRIEVKSIFSESANESMDTPSDGYNNDSRSGTLDFQNVDSRNDLKANMFQKLNNLEKKLDKNGIEHRTEKIEQDEIEQKHEDESREGDEEAGEDGEVESIVLNFPHSAVRKQLEHGGSSELKKKTSNLYTPTHSETVSLSSYEDSCEDESHSEIDIEYPGQPLALTMTRSEGNTPNDSLSSHEVSNRDSVSELSSVSRSLHSLGSSTSLEDDDDSEGTSSDYSVLSILPSISISDSLGHFRLVLQSSLVQNPSTKEIFTAIRQSNNEPTVANVEDDWLLYDSKFSMDNLQMVTLQDFLDTNRSFPKIIFYSMIVVSDQEALQRRSSQRSTTNELFAPSQNTLLGTTENQDHISDIDSDVSLSNEPKQFYPSSDREENDYDDASLSEKSDPKMYAPTRIQSNATTAHRSIRTVNSIGDWAFLHNVDTDQSNIKSDSSHPQEPNVHFNKNTNGLQLSTVCTTSRGGLSKVNTIASMGSVERSKSTPLPIILKSLSIDNEGKRWKSRMESFRRKRNHKSKPGEKNCTVM